MTKRKITEILKSKNMSFSELADGINVKRTTLIYNLSNEKIPLKYLIDISKFLKVNIDDLMEEEKVDIRGYVRYGNKYFKINMLNDFVEITNLLVKECGLESELYYQSPKNEIE